jgi:ribosomal protein S18 acetylase RimI-like enzyme
VSAVDVRLVDAATVRPLRHAMLRAGRPAEESFYPPDELDETIHLAAYVNDEVVGTVTFFPEPLDGEPAWRLRGMAVDRALQNSGIGSTIMHEMTRRLREHGVTLLWCNARTSALGFYRKQGFEVVGEEFIADASVPHYRAILQL